MAKRRSSREQTPFRSQSPAIESTEVSRRAFLRRSAQAAALTKKFLSTT